MRSYYRVMLGRQSSLAAECLAGNFIGAGFEVGQDLTGRLSDSWRAFNQEFRPIYMSLHPDKSKVAAGLACGFLWTVAKGIRVGDTVLCPDGTGTYRIGEVVSDYFYVPGTALPHRRNVRWTGQVIDRSEMSGALKRSTGSIGTVCDISGYRDEIEALLSESLRMGSSMTDPETVEDLATFALEKHLEEFLIANWNATDLGRDYDIFTEDGEQVGQQYPSDTGPMDILAISKDRKELLVVELKKGRASDSVVGQVLRYMGFVAEELAENGQKVRGVIIAQDDDQRVRRALAMTPNISFYRYEVSFKLKRG